jgi:tetratricopeptide (TPR) repeat protein
VFFNLQPGKAGKAEVDLALGEPARKLEADGEQYEYAPPAGAAEAQRVVVSFFPDTMRAERLDVYMKSPLPAQDLRAQFGGRLLSRVRHDKAHEELFYPALQGMILNKPGGAAVAVSYLSPRMLADIYANRFNELVGTKRYKEALVEADKIVLIDPDYSRGYVARGLYYFYQNDYTQAASHFQAAFQAQYAPRSKAIGHIRLGEMYAKNMNLMEQGLAQFQAALALAPDYAMVHVDYGKFLLWRNENDRAAAEFAKAAELEPKSEETRYAIAEALYVAMQWAQALPHWEFLVNWQEAKGALEASIERKTEIYFKYGFCLQQARRREEAVAAYDKCINLDARHSLAHLNKGWILLQEGQLNQADVELRKALDLAPEDSYANGHLAELLLKRGEIEAALRQAEKALSLAPNTAWILANMARCFAARWQKDNQADDKVRAAEFLRKAGDAGLRDDGTLGEDPHLRAILARDQALRKLLQVR